MSNYQSYSINFRGHCARPFAGNRNGKLFVQLMLAMGILVNMSGERGAALAASQIKLPACDAGLNAWAATVKPTETYNVAPNLPLPSALRDETIVPVFGTGVLNWTGDDVNVASAGLVACYKDAAKRRDAQTMNALKTANIAVAGTLAKTLAWLDRVRVEVDKQTAALKALPDSIELDKALGALVSADPAKPNLESTRGLAQEIVAPVWAIAKVLPSIPDRERETLMAGLGERRTAIQGGTANELGAMVASTPATADGVIAIMEARQRITPAAENESLAASYNAAGARAEEIRASLRQATPTAWVPPDCADLYRWSGAAGARDTVYLGPRSTYTAFVDERVVPVFGVSIGKWGSEDFNRFQKLRAVCRATWQALPGAAAVNNPPPDAPELLTLASKGAWVDGADAPIQQAQTIVQAYGEALAALAIVQSHIDALPATSQSLVQLRQFANDPALQGVDEATRQAFRAALLAKQNAIAMKATDDAIAGLDGIQVSAMNELVNLVVYGNKAMVTIPDHAGQQRFSAAYERAMGGAIAKVLPEFRTKVEKMPASFEGLRQVRAAVTDLTGVTESEKVPAFAGFHEATFTRTKAIIETMRKENCAALLKELKLHGDTAKELVWDGKQGNPLGTFVCGLTQGGMAVKGFDKGGLISGDPSLKVQMGIGGLQTVMLHKAEVTKGQKMLIGYKIADANQEKPISVEEWAFFAASSSGGRFVTQEICGQVFGKPEDKLSAEERMVGVDCMVEVISGNMR